MNFYRDPPESAKGSAEKAELGVASLFLQQCNVQVITHGKGDKSFMVQREMLVRNSEYFASRLRDPASSYYAWRQNENESASTSGEKPPPPTIWFDDVDPESFGVYLWFDLQVSTRSVPRLDRQALEEPNDLRLLIDVYHLASRFRNPILQQRLYRIIKAAIADATVDQRHKIVDNYNTWWVRNFLAGYKKLDTEIEEEKALGGAIVEAFCRLLLKEGAEAMVRRVDQSEKFRLAVMNHLVSLNTGAHAPNEKPVEASTFVPAEVAAPRAKASSRILKAIFRRKP